MLTNSSLLIDGDRFRMESPEATYEGIFTIDVEQVPHHIDIDFVEGPEAGIAARPLRARRRPIPTVPRSGRLSTAGAFRDQSRQRPCFGGIDTQAARAPSRCRWWNAAQGSGQAGVCRLEADFECLLTPTLQKLQVSGCPRTGHIRDSNAGRWLPFGARTHTGIETKVVFGGQTQVHAKVRINESASPMEVDYYNLVRKAKGSISLGLFRWDGDEAVFCMAPPGAPRPQTSAAARVADEHSAVGSGSCKSLTPVPACYSCGIQRAIVLGEHYVADKSTA